MRHSAARTINRLPAVMQKFSGRPVEGEPVSAIRCRLVVPAINRPSCKMAVEQSAGAAMTYNGKIARIGRLREDLLDGTDNSRMARNRGSYRPPIGQTSAPPD